MEVEEEMVEIHLQHEGETYSLLVDRDTAEILMNEPEQAHQYMEELLGSAMAPTPALDEAPSIDSDQEEEQPTTSTRQPPNNSLKRVWYSKGKPSRDDDEATTLFLQLRAEYAQQFSDKKTKKMVLWDKISTRLKAAGFDICPGKDGAAAKAKQKFTNLSTAYMNHLQSMRTTGQEHKEAPPFFAELHSILGGKDKSDPQNCLSSSLEPAEPTDLASEEEHETVVKKKRTIENRFSTTQPPSLRPQSKADKILDVIQAQSEADRKKQDEQFQDLKTIFLTQMEQTGSLIGLLSQIVNRQRDSD